MYLKAAVAYFSIISIISIIVTVYDKSAAIKKKRRIRENTLMLLAALGGSIFMLITMKIIHHKTKHLKFMLGIPAIIILQAAFVYNIFIYYIK